MRRLAAIAVVVGLLMGGCASATPSGTPPAPKPTPASLPTSPAATSIPAPASPTGTPSPTPAAAPPSRWIAVSVATLWVRPGIARPVDAPALGNPADPRAWVEGMTVDQKRWLVGKLETQALYGTRVRLLATRGSWSRIAVPSQPTPRNRWGYPGWVPTVQLSRTAPAAAPRLAVVRRPTTWLWASPSWTGRAMEISYGTRLPVAAATSTAVEVVMLGGRHLFLRRAAVALHGSGAPWPTPTGPRLVGQAKRFMGLQYLWAGTSGFGFDCSGLTSSVYRALGLTLPRDADAQFAVGTRIGAVSDLRPGDLVFFRDAAGTIHHVGMYVGEGRMIHSPGTGLGVAVVSLAAEPYASEFAGGRRYTG